MKTNPFKDLKLPALGFGCMRLPRKDGAVDEAETAEMIAYAMAHGVNYFDTGYDYHDGMSERVLGKILSSYDRNSFLLADKFPGYDPLRWRKVEKVFEDQLVRLGVDYFDFYLFHNVNEMNIDAYLDPKYGIFDYLCRQKENGRIRHLGFSVHGSTETTRRFLEAYGDAMEFCQIQLNYIDYEFQKANEKIALLRQYGIPVWVMEPLRGGKLTALPSPFNARLAAMDATVRPIEWAFRFVRSFPEVALTLSGMSSMAQLADNIAIFEEDAGITEVQKQTLIAIAQDMTAIGTVPCTSCRYCTAHCPKELDIPKLLGYYNEHTYSGGGFIAPSAIAALPRDKKPNACVGCRACEALCPQGIKISEILSALSETVGLKKN